MVHAFPNVNLNSIQQSPVNLSTLTSIDVNIEWSMHPSVLTTATSLDASALEGVSAIANVAFDMVG